MSSHCHSREEHREFTFQLLSFVSMSLSKLVNTGEAPMVFSMARARPTQLAMDRMIFEEVIASTDTDRMKGEYFDPVPGEMYYMTLSGGVKGQTPLVMSVEEGLDRDPNSIELFRVERLHRTHYGVDMIATDGIVVAPLKPSRNKMSVKALYPTHSDFLLETSWSAFALNGRNLPDNSTVINQRVENPSLVPLTSYVIHKRGHYYVTFAFHAVVSRGGVDVELRACGKAFHGRRSATRGFGKDAVLISAMIACEVGDTLEAHLLTGRLLIGDEGTDPRLVGFRYPQDHGVAWHLGLPTSDGVQLGRNSASEVILEHPSGVFSAADYTVRVPIGGYYFLHLATETFTMDPHWAVVETFSRNEALSGPLILQTGKSWGVFRGESSDGSISSVSRSIVMHLGRGDELKVSLFNPSSNNSITDVSNSYANRLIGFLIQ